MKTNETRAREILRALYGQHPASKSERLQLVVKEALDAAEQRGIDSCKSACEATVGLCEKTLRDIQEAP